MRETCWGSTIFSRFRGERGVRYLLDNNVVSYFFQARRHADLAATAGRVSLALSEEVHDELARAPAFGQRFAAWFPTSGITMIPIVIGSEADGIEQELSVGLTTPRGRGERASIALAAVDPELCFVANDRNALWIALRELHATGERIIGLPVLLRRLHELGGMPREAAEAVMTISTLPKPTWWARWIAR
jgi:hypothetical protein